jgi:hypothetical protein
VPKPSPPHRRDRGEEVQVSVARAKRLSWLVGLLAVLLVLGFMTLRTDRDRASDEGVRGAGLVGDGAAPTRTGQEDASPGLLSPFTPVLDAVVTALTGSDEDADVDRCVPSSWDSAARRTPKRTIVGGVARDVDRARVAPVSEAPGTSVSGRLHC